MQQKAKSSGKIVQMHPRTKAAGAALDPRKARALHQQDRDHLVHGFIPLRSEERRVGKECRL